MAAFINGLRISELYYKLAKKPLRTLEELLNRVYATANAEKASHFKRESKSGHEDKQRKNGNVDP